MKFSIRSKMMIFFCFSIIIFSVIIGLFVLLNVNRTFIPMTKEHNEKQVQVKANEMGKLIENYTREIELLSLNNIFKSGNKNSIKYELAKISEDINPDFNCLKFVDLNGDYVTCTNLEGNDSTTDYYQQVILGSRNSFISDAITSETSGEDVLIVCHDVTNSQGKKIGAVSSEVSIDSLREMVSNVMLTDDTNAYIVDGSGLIVTHSSATAKIADANDNNVTIISKSIPNTNNWSFAISIPSIYLIQESNLVKISPYLSGLLILLFIIFFLIYGTLTKPIKKMAKYLNTLANNDYTVEVPSKLMKRKDEIGSIAKSINSMNQHNINLALNIIYEANETKENIQLVSEKLNNLSSSVFEATETVEASIAEIEMEVNTSTINIKNGTSPEIKSFVNVITNSSQDYTKTDKETRRVQDIISIDDVRNNLRTSQKSAYGDIHNLANISESTITDIHSITDRIVDSMDSLTYSSEKAFHLTNTQANKNEKLKNIEDVYDDIKIEKSKRNKFAGKKTLVEEYRMLQLKIDTKLKEESMKVISFTSVIPFEKKSEHVYNIARSFVLEGKKVLIIDCNNNNLNILKYFGIITEVVIGAVSGENHIFNEIFQHIYEVPRIKGLDVIPAGTVLTEAGEVLNVDRIQKLIEKVRDKYDSILIDSPCAGSSSEGIKLSLIADGTIIAIRSGKTPKAAAKKVNKMMSAVKANVLGVIFVGDC